MRPLFQSLRLEQFAFVHQLRQPDAQFLLDGFHRLRQRRAQG